MPQGNHIIYVFNNACPNDETHMRDMHIWGSHIAIAEIFDYGKSNVRY